jgi:hypothetical protein
VLSANRLVHRHLSERELLVAWSKNRRFRHLDACMTCRDRYAALVEFLDQQRTDAAASADAAFTSERLAAQKSHIVRRLENLARPVRVLPFPLSRRATPLAGSSARHWVAVAAAAGLIVGLAAGMALNVQPFASDSPVHSVASNPGTDAGRLASPSVGSNDEAFLTEIESAVVGPRVEALEALDALTPRVYEASMIVR